jgi:hypothetical protein
MIMHWNNRALGCVRVSMVYRYVYECYETPAVKQTLQFSTKVVLVPATYIAI